MTLNQIAERLVEELVKVVHPPEDIHDPPPTGVAGIFWRETHCKPVAQDVEDAIQVLVADAKQRQIKFFYRLSPISPHLGVKSATCEGNRVFVRVIRESYPKEMLTLGLMAQG